MNKNLNTRLLKLVSALFFLCIPFLGNAQVTKEDVVYTKKGWVIRGEILELDSDKSVKIQTRDGNIFLFEMTDVDRITKEDPFVSQRLAKPVMHKKNMSLYHVTEVGLQFGNNDPNPMIRMALGWYINPYLSAGIGVGFENLDWGVEELPITAEVRGEFMKNRQVSPFYFANAGYGIAVVKDGWGWVDEKGGLAWQTGLGIKFNTRHEAAYLLSLSFKHNEHTRTMDWGNVLRTEREFYNAISFQMGIIF